MLYPNCFLLLFLLLDYCFILGVWYGPYHRPLGPGRPRAGPGRARVWVWAHEPFLALRDQMGRCLRHLQRRGRLWLCVYERMLWVLMHAALWLLTGPCRGKCCGAGTFQGHWIHTGRHHVVNTRIPVPVGPYWAHMSLYGRRWTQGPQCLVLDSWKIPNPKFQEGFSPKAASA